MFPYDLESSYSSLIGQYVDLISREYLKLLRQALIESGIKPESYKTNDLREYKRNGVVLDRIIELKNKVIAPIIKKRMLAAMERVLYGLHDRVVKNIEKSYRTRAKALKREILEDEIPTMALNADSQKLKEAIQNNVNLIQAITEKHNENLEKSVRLAIESGSSFETIIDEVQSQSTKGRSYAEFVARDQAAKAYASINEEKQKNAGFDGYIWIDTNDGKTRNSHREHHGEFNTWDKPPLINFALDNQKRTPEHLHPGEDYQCRCIALPAFDKSDIENLSSIIRRRTYK